MLIQRTGVILCQHRHSLNMGVGHVAERKINGSIASCHRHSRNGTLVGQFPHSVVISSSQYNSNRSHYLSPAFINVSPLSSTPSR